jgi:putative DNA primase/helicase
VRAAISARDLAGRLNLAKYPRSWRGRCPACDYPGNVFSMREPRCGKTPRMYCANGCDREALDDALSRVIAGWRPEPRDNDDPANMAERRAARQEAARRLWSGSELHGHEVYLAARGLASLAASPALRFRGDCHHPEGGRLGAMVALVQDVAGAPVAVHRTYLNRSRDAKTSVEPAKASLGPVWGSAVRLHDTAPELVIGEGIESSASAALLLALPAWAAVSAGNLAKGLVLPPAVRSVIVAADPDPQGERAAVSAAQRWRAEGRTARIARPTGSGDFNDVLRSRSNG